MENEHSLPKGKLIAAAAIIVLLAALAIGYFILKDKAPLPEEESEAEAYEVLFSAELSDIKSVTVKNSDGKTTVSRSGEKFTVSPEDNALTQDILKFYLENYTKIVSIRALEGGEVRLDEYKISKSENYFEITLTDNSKRRFCIGESTNGNYYCLDAANEKVYLVPESIGKTLLCAPKASSSQSEALSISIDYDNIYYAELKKGGEDVLAFKRVGNKTALPYNFYASYELTKPFSDIAYTTEFTEFLKSISITLTPAGHMGSAEDAPKYGIGSGYTLTVKDNSKTHILRFGERCSMGVYMTYNDYPYIYIVSDDILTALEGADALHFATPYIDLYHIDNLAEIIIKSGKTEHTLTIDNQKGEYKLDKKAISQKSFDAFYDKLSDITVYYGSATTPTKGSEICQITYVQKDGTKYIRNYYDCQSEMVYLTKKESGIEVTVKKASLDAALSALNNLAK